MASEKKLSKKQLEVLKKNQFTSEQSREAAARNGSKGGINCARNKSLRKLGLQMLDAAPQVNEDTLKQLKRLGMETDSPDMKTIILGRIFALTMSKDAKVAMQATQMIMEITGNDVRSMIAAERNQLERERIMLERERMERDKSAAEHESVRIIRAADGGIEVIDDE